MSYLLGWITWNPSREIFRIPYFDHPLTWYGFFFALGFLVGFFIENMIFQKILGSNEKQPMDEATLKKVKEESLKLTDKITWYIVIGTVVGARLGHVFFYDWPRYQNHLFDILKVWEGGLASHGGAIGILLAIALFRRSIKNEYPSLTYLRIVDMVCIPAAFAGFCIRIGNFFNQEILGNYTEVPWAIIFKNPIDGGYPIPRHPAQLYEALACLATFFILFTLWKVKGEKIKTGTISGLFMILIFGSRFLIEFVKTPLSLMIDESQLHAGQLLSIPFIALGICLLFSSSLKSSQGKRAKLL